MSALDQVLTKGGNPTEFPFIPTATEESVPMSKEPKDNQFYPRVYRVPITAEFEADRPTEAPVSMDCPAGVGLGFRFTVEFTEGQTESGVFRGVPAMLLQYVHDFEDQESIVTIDPTTSMLISRHIQPSERVSIVDSQLGYVNMRYSEAPNGTTITTDGPAGTPLTQMNTGPFPRYYFMPLHFPSDSPVFFGVDDMGNSLKTKAGQYRHQMTLTLAPMEYWFTNDTAVINYDNVIQPTMYVEYWYYAKTNAYVDELIDAQRKLGLIGSTWGLERMRHRVDAGYEGTLDIELTPFTGANAYIFAMIHTTDTTDPWDAVPLGRFEAAEEVKLYEADREVVRFVGDPAKVNDNYVMETLFGRPIAASSDEPIYCLSSSLTSDLSNPLGEITPGLGRRSFRLQLVLAANDAPRTVYIVAVNHAAIGYTTVPGKDGFFGYDM